LHFLLFDDRAGRTPRRCSTLKAFVGMLADISNIVTTRGNSIWKRDEC